jgi:predicted transposase YbfD/YdcC
MKQKKQKKVHEELSSDVLMGYFEAIEDPRIERSRLHSLTSLLVLSMLAVICGADSFVGIAQFGKAKETWLRTVLDFDNGIPSHDTLGRVFAMLNPAALEGVFRDWMAAIAGQTNGGVVAIDGKTLRHSFKKPGSGFIHMVSAWSAANRVVLGQVKTDEKSNEITAIPRLLELLQLKNCLVTIDAMGCQKDIAAKIVESEADYLLAVKDNQPTLAADVTAVFQEARQNPELLEAMDLHSTEEKGHGRKEIRRCWTIPLASLKLLGVDEASPTISQAKYWIGLKSLVLVESERTVGGKTTLEQRHYICSKANISAKEAMAASRSHWSIENELHWVLDVAFREDECRVRAGNAGENFAVVRHIALNLLKSVKGTKVGIHNRRLRAGWDNDFLIQVLGAIA